MCVKFYHTFNHYATYDGSHRNIYYKGSLVLEILRNRSRALSSRDANHCETPK